jgi:hypothetical protein
VLSRPKAKNMSLVRSVRARFRVWFCTIMSGSFDYHDHLYLYKHVFIPEKVISRTPHVPVTNASGYCGGIRFSLQTLRWRGS